MQVILSAFIGWYEMKSRWRDQQTLINNVGDHCWHEADAINNEHIDVILVDLCVFHIDLDDPY